MSYVWFTGINWPLRKIVTLFLRPLVITTISHMETMLKKHTVARTSIHWHVYNDKALYNDWNTFLTLQILFPISGI
jgi:hypothetical protein